MGWERDNANGDIWEWSDSPVASAVERSEVQKLSSAGDVTLRFEGRQYVKDKAVTEKQKKAMREVIQAYKKATGKPW